MAEDDIENDEIETPEPEVDDETEELVSEDTDDEEEEEVVVSIGEGSPPSEDEKAPDWVRDLRKAHREAIKENREMRARLEAEEKAKTAQKLRPKPKLSDFDYDEDALAEDLIKWASEAEAAESVQKAQKKQAEEQQKAYEQKFEAYQSASRSMKVRDFEDAEMAVQEALSEAQQGMLIHGAAKPELLVYALGRDPERMKAISSITDPVQFAFAAGKLEAELKVTIRKPSSQPEKRVSGGTGGRGGTADKTLDRLREKAAVTGDMSPVLAYKAKLRAAQLTE